MKRILNILIIILVYVFLCGKSCGDDSGMALLQQQRIAEEKDSIRCEFEVDDYTEESLYAAEITAIQKLEDLADYFSIYFDVTLDSNFREKAREMIRDMFISEDVMLSIKRSGGKDAGNISVRQFLESGFGEDIQSAEIAFDSVRIAEPLQKTGEESYSGRIGCRQTLTLYTPTDTLVAPHQAMTVKIYSTKTDKVFGNDTLSVWKVFLGEMDQEKP